MSKTLLLNKQLCSAFADGKTFVTLSPNELYIYNTKTNASAVHFPASSSKEPFTCLSWKLRNQQNEQISSDVEVKQKKFSKSKVSNYFAVGVSSGDIILLSKKGKEISKCSGCHSDQVNCIAWLDDSVFYSGSSDRSIAEWNISDSTHKWKQKADTCAVTSICIGPYSRTLISAGKTIKLWHIKTKELLRKFTGNKSPIFSLSVLNFSSFSSWQPKTALESLDGVYFVSAAYNDKSIKTWKIDALKKKKNVSNFYSLPSCPRFVDVMQPTGSDKPAHLVALTDDEQIFVFSYVSNGSAKSPASPFKTIKLLSESASPLPIVSTTFEKKVKKDWTIMTIAYGTASNVHFLSVNLSKHAEQDIIVYCKDPAEKSPAKIVNEVQYNDKNDGESVSTKRRKQSNNSEQLTLEEKMEILHTETTEKVDSKVMTSKQKTKKPTEMESTVVSSSVFLDRISNDFECNVSEYLTHVRWIKETINQNPSLLLDNDQSSRMWERLNHVTEVSKQLNGVLPRLQGKLDLIANQIVHQQRRAGSEDAALVFEEESSDDEVDCIPYISDSLDEWDGDAGNAITTDTERNSDWLSDGTRAVGQEES